MSDEHYGMTKGQYHAWRVACVCEGCGAVPDEEHLEKCSVRWNQAPA